MHGKFKSLGGIFKMSENENILRCEVNSILKRDNLKKTVNKIKVCPTTENTADNLTLAQCHNAQKLKQFSLLNDSLSVNNIFHSQAT